MKKNINFLFILLAAINIAKGQDLDISQYTFTRDIINPASFIQFNDINALVLYSNEFSGFEQQPNVLMADVCFRLMEDYKLGLSVTGDVIGYDNTQKLKLRFARQFAISEKSFFSLGLSTGALLKSLETTKMTFEENDDPLSYQDLSETSFDFDFGIEFQFNKLFLGFSAGHLWKEFENPEFQTPVSHYYGYAQLTINSMRAIWFYPHVMARYYREVHYGEMGLIALIKDKFWLGTSYSIYHDLVGMAGFRLRKNILFGYAYKTNMNGELLNPGTTNTHEVFLSFSFNKSQEQIKSVRFID